MIIFNLIHDIAITNWRRKMLTNIFVLFILIIISAMFSAADIAILSVNSSTFKILAKQGNKKAITIMRHLEEPTKIFPIIRIGVTLSGLLASAFAANTFAAPLTNFIMKYAPSINAHIIQLVSTILVTIVLSSFMLVFGDFVPRRLAMKNPDKAARLLVLPVSLFTKIVSPFAKILIKASNLIATLLGAEASSNHQDVTEEEILLMINEGNERGFIEESQKNMINNIFEFGDLIVSDVMTHRTDLVSISADAKISEIVYLAINEGYSRIPVFENSVDNIVGIIYIKDLLCLVGCENSEDFTIDDFIRDIHYVPESMPCDDLFKELTSKKEHISVVVDEYGGTAGIVTMEDLIEAIMGNIQDEYDDEDDEIQTISDNTYLIDGTANPDDILDKLGIDLVDDHEYDTIGGYITDLLGYIPEESETPSIKKGDVKFTVILTEDRRISKVKAEVLQKS